MLQVDEDHVFAKIGRLVVEAEGLEQLKAQAEAQLAAVTMEKKRLLALLLGIKAGNVDPERIKVDIKAGTWLLEESPESEPEPAERNGTH